LDAARLATLGVAAAERAVLEALRRAAASRDAGLRRRQLRELQRSVHPDKWPSDRQELATRLFQVLESHREAALMGIVF